jgi:predicted ester cyclase
MREVIEVSENENLTQLRRVVEEAFGKGDVGVLDETMTPDFIEHEEMPGMGSGLEGLKNVIRMVRQAFPDLRIEIDDTISSGDQVCVRQTFSGTNTGSFMGNPPTGKSASWESIDIISFRNGRLAEHWGQMDMIGLFTQLGLAGMPAAA